MDIIRGVESPSPLLPSLVYNVGKTPNPLHVIYYQKNWNSLLILLVGHSLTFLYVVYIVYLGC